MKQEVTLYMLLDCQASIKKMKGMAADWNKKCKSTYKEDYKKYTLKETHIYTAEQFINTYYQHTLNNKKHRRSPEHYFDVTNTLLAKRTGAHKKTMQEHIKRLQLCGFIVEKRYRGTNAAPRYYLNTEALVPRWDVEIAQMLPNLPDGNMPSFTSGCTAIRIFCNHTESQEALKNKDGKAEVDFAGSVDDVENPFGEINASVLSQDGIGHKKHWKQGQGISYKAPSARMAPNLQAGAAKSQPDVNYLVIIALNLLLKILYAKRKVTPQQIEGAKVILCHRKNKIKKPCIAARLSLLPLFTPAAAPK
jgi:hypothetical protein